MKARIFIIIAGVILTITAFAKLISAFKPAGYLSLRDPLFEFFTNRQLLSGAAAVELVVVILLMWVKNDQKRLALIAWISSMFVLYRLAVYFVKAPGYIPCPCLGNAAAWMHLDPKHLDLLTKAMLTYLVIGSYGLLIGSWLHKQKEPSVLVSSSSNVVEV